MAESLLEQMANNPKAGWSIRDVATVCAQHGVACKPPRGGGSHYKVYHPQARAILTIPSRRSIKPVYIRRLVDYIKALTARNA
jgi:hypothetical protein